MKVDFNKYIESNCCYDIDKLDAAVLNGISRAKNDKLERTKIFKCAIALAASLFIVSNINTLTVPENLYVRNKMISEQNSAILHSYLETAAENAAEYLSNTNIFKEMTK